MINKDLQYVGLIFDGVARAVSVHSQGILHSLDKIYRMKRLAGEIRKSAGF